MSEKPIDQWKQEVLMADTILNTVSDLVANFAYYDRKDDEDLSAEQLRDAIESGVVSLEEIINEFSTSLRGAFYGL